MTWTPEKIKSLKKLWQKGKSTVEIGKALGISKNAVVGKVHRLELTARPSPIKSKSGAKPATKAAAKTTKSSKTSVPPTKTVVKLMDLKLTSCRWPIGDPKDPDFHFCGKTTQTGKSYCPEHCKMAYISLRELTLQNAKNKKEREKETAQ